MDPATARTPRVLAVSWAKKALKLALLGPAMLGREDAPGLFVLIYHRVGAGQGREMDMPAARFARQMRELSDRDELVGLRDGLDRLSTGALERDLVAVTFDDGYREVFDHAWPILRDLGVPATVFLPTAFVQGDAPPPIRPGAADRGALARPLTWDQIGEMASTGLFAVGSHSVTHTDFDRISRTQAEEESGASRALLEARTGAVIDLFAYPRAIVAHEDVVAEHYRYAVAADGVKNRVGRTDPRRIARTPIRDSDGMFFFRRRLHGMRPLEDRVYARLRSLGG
jgi:peptidoglycan/xylan/chitin deacetylase (PgdA/CDA1 family)